MSAHSSPLVSKEYQDQLARKGQALYETKFKALLEPVHNNQYIVIHVDTEDYAIGRSLAVAKRLLRQRHTCDGRLVGMKIGPEPEYGLAARLIASHQGAAPK